MPPQWSPSALLQPACPSAIADVLGGCDGDRCAGRPRPFTGQCRWREWALARRSSNGGRGKPMPVRNQRRNRCRRDRPRPSTVGFFLGGALDGGFCACVAGPKAFVAGALYQGPGSRLRHRSMPTAFTGRRRGGAARAQLCFLIFDCSNSQSRSTPVCFAGRGGFARSPFLVPPPNRGGWARPKGGMSPDFAGKRPRRITPPGDPESGPGLTASKTDCVRRSFDAPLRYLSRFRVSRWTGLIARPSVAPHGFTPGEPLGGGGVYDSRPQVPHLRPPSVADVLAKTPPRWDGDARKASMAARTKQEQS